MSRCVLLLRGINVGGRNKLPMADLRACLEALGGTEVETYVQSGNAVVTLSAVLEKTISSRLKTLIEDQHGFEPAVLRVTAAGLQQVIDRNPFPVADTAPTTVHVSFLEASPQPDAAALLDELKADSESYRLDGSVFYLHAPDGIGRSKLAAGAERAFGCAATGRNWRTIRALAEMLAE